MSGLEQYRLLGRSGLRVSPMALGTMTFGEPWGADADASRAIFEAYTSAGGNFIDTANFYAAGRSEELVGSFAAGRRDTLVLATKYSFATRPGDPNSGGNHRKSLMRALEDSLARLRTDYIDLYYLHAWDGTTPVDEVMRALDDAVRQGKILYAAISDTPAWQIARMQTMADLRGWSPLVALQTEYSLVERTSERDLIPAAQALGLGVLPWSPLASGRLSGKYGAASPSVESGGRRTMLEAHGMLDARTLRIAERVNGLATEIGCTPAQVALAWVLANAAVTAPILGARTVGQLADNLGALQISLAPDRQAMLDGLSAIELGFPHDFLKGALVQGGVSGGASIRPRGPGSS